MLKEGIWRSSQRLTLCLFTVRPSFDFLPFPACHVIRSTFMRRFLSCLFCWTNWCIMTMVSIMVKKISGRAESPPPVRSSQQNRAFSHFFVLHFPYMARDPTIFLVNFITFCALNKWSKFGKNGRCLNIFKTKKLHYLLHYPIVSIVKCMRLQCIFQKI